MLIIRKKKPLRIVVEITCKISTNLGKVVRPVTKELKKKSANDGRILHSESQTRDFHGEDIIHQVEFTDDEKPELGFEEEMFFMDQ